MNKEEYKLDLPLEYRVQNSLLAITLYASYWIMNRTNEMIAFKMDDKESYLYRPDNHNPQLFEYLTEKSSKKAKICLKVADSQFSSNFPINVAPNKYNHILPVSGNKSAYQVLVRIEASRLSQTKIIYVEPFYSVINLTKERIFFSENNEDWFSVDSNQLLPFYPKNAINQSICFRSFGNDFDSKV